MGPHGPIALSDVFPIGYDLMQVNLYINKLFENVGNLVYEEVDDSDRCIFQVNGVQSSLGETLIFEEVADRSFIHSFVHFFSSYSRSCVRVRLSHGSMCF